MRTVASRWYSALVTSAVLAVAVAVPMGWTSAVSANGCQDSGSFSGGDGSSSVPFQISSPGDLMHLSASTSAWTGKHFVQTANLDMTGCAWTPIGTPGWRQGGIPFQGSYDGGNFAIDNLTVTATDDYRGLFGWAEDSTFRRMDLDIVITGADDTVGGLIGYAEGVTVADVDVTVDISGLTGGNVGGLIGEGGDATISATTVTGTVESGGGFATGGLIGMTYYNGLTITDVTVSADVMHPVTADSSVGGLIGESGEAETVITRASFSGRVSASAQSSAGGFVGVGGFVGNHRFGDLTITNSSVASGSTVVGGRKVGGLIGRLEANAAGEEVDIADSAVAAAVTATGDDAGGLIGAVEVSGTGTTMSVSNTSVEGTLTSSASNAGGLMGYVQVGAPSRPSGLIHIDGATATVNVTAVTTSAGGLIGYVTTSGQMAVLAAENMTATGNVTMPPGGYQAGGLLGFLGGNGVIGVQNATASGDVNVGRWSQYPLSGAGGAVGVVNSTGVVSLSTVSATGDVFGRGGSLGGLVGSMRVTANNRGPKVMMTNVSAAGNVLPTQVGALWVGGLVGDLTAYELEMTDASATGTVSGAGEVGGLVGLLNITGPAAYATSSMTRVSAGGSVTADSGRAGGLIGSLVAEGALLLSDASATGNVDAGKLSGNSDSGGLIGMLAVENREDSHVTILRSSATNDVEGNGDRLGGLVGFVTMPSGDRVGVDIAESYTMQSVRVANGSSVRAVGGLVGEVKASYGPLRISDSYSHRELLGAMTEAGGLIGRAEASSVFGVEIQRSYATNPFPGYPFPDPTPPFGGLIGVTVSAGAPVSVSASFRESGGGTGTSLGTAATRTALKAASTFTTAGWSMSNGVSDSTKTWAICSDLVYPFLMWQSDEADAWLDGAQTCGSGQAGGDDGGSSASALVLPPALPGLVNQPVSTPTTVPPTTVPSTTPPTTVAPPSTVPAPVPANGGVLPSLAPGANQVLVDGRPVAVEVFVANSTDLVMRGNDFELRLAGDCASGCTIATTADGRQVLTLEERGLAKVDGDGFRPGTPVYVWLFSEPRFLGELTVNADGTFTGTVPLGDIVPGEHTLQVNGTSADGKPRTANLGVVVNPSGAPSPEGGGVLPATGHDVTSWWMMAVLMTVVGLGVLGRRRRTPVC